MPATAASQRNINTILRQLENEGNNVITVDCVIFGFDDDALKVLLIKSDLENFSRQWSLPHTCYEWLQKRIQEHPLGFSLLPKQFSLREVQNLYEAIPGVKLDRRNFRKKFFSTDLLEDTGEYEKAVPHRPGKLYHFNDEKFRQKERKKWFGIDF
ncbi:MAG: hypothetical protein ABIU63_01530 [Chitinophagaceae bacterium]